LSNFEFKVDVNSDPIRISISGSIDENAEFKHIDLNDISRIDIDLNGVRSINSLGARAYIKWLSSLSKFKISFFNCPKIIIDQINMVSTLLPKNAKVLSLYVPFFNEDSGEEKYVLFRHGKDYDDTVVNLPKDITDSSGLPMEIGVIETRYFKFLVRK
jgi:hypothetical protein